MKGRTVLLLVVTVALGSTALVFLYPTRPDEIGVRDGRLAPCPPAPNCVSSFEVDGDHHVDPIPFAGAPEDALGRLERALESVGGATVITRDGRYLHAEVRTPMMRFVDDVEFLVDTDRGLIQVRSASRAGYSDLGANRERVERLREAFATGEPPTSPHNDAEPGSQERE